MVSASSVQDVGATPGLVAVPSTKVTALVSTSALVFVALSSATEEIWGPARDHAEPERHHQDRKGG